MRLHQGEQDAAEASYAYSFGRGGRLARRSVGCDKLKARDKLNKGVNAYKDGQFDRAIEDFKQAKELDPTLTNAQLYLATAYSAPIYSRRPSQENLAMAIRPSPNLRTFWLRSRQSFRD